MYRLVFRKLLPLNAPAEDVWVGPWHETAQAAYDEVRLQTADNKCPPQRWMLKSYLPLFESESGCRSHVHAMNLNHD